MEDHMVKQTLGYPQEIPEGSGESGYPDEFAASGVDEDGQHERAQGKPTRMMSIPQTAFMVFHVLLILAAVILVFVMKDDNTFTMVVNFAVAGVILLFITMLYLFRRPEKVSVFVILILIVVAVMNGIVAVFKLMKKNLFDKSIVDPVLLGANIVAIIIMAVNSRITHSVSSFV